MGLLADAKAKALNHPLSSLKRNVPQTGLGVVCTRTNPIVVPPRPQIVSIHGEVLATSLPKGYSLISRNQLDKLYDLRDRIIKLGIMSVDYETDSDIDDEALDTQDHNLAGVSISCEVGSAYYLPIMHDSYGANWDVTWLVANFLKPLMEDIKIMTVIHNVKAEHGWSLLYGIDMFDKACAGMVSDTMLLIKNLALPETIAFDGRVVMGLKESVKSLLADKETGLVHGLLHVDDIKSFKETVGRVEWQEPVPGEFYKSGNAKLGRKKGDPKTKTVSRARRFTELPVDQDTIDYGCSDADWALGLHYMLMPYAESAGLTELIMETDIPFMMVLAEYELAGWHIDRPALVKLGQYADTELAKIVPKLNEAMLELVEARYPVDRNEEGEMIVPACVCPMGRWRGNDVALEIKTEKPFNWASTQHMQWLLFHILGMDTKGVKRSKDTGLPSCGSETLDVLVDSYEGDSTFMTLLKEKRKFDKINTTYVNGMMPYCRADTDKIHTLFSLVATWRLSSKAPNCQNIPRLDNDPMGIRNIFISPKYDLNYDYSHLRSPMTMPNFSIFRDKLCGETVFVSADYSQIELKILAWFAMEHVMIDILANGGDIHSAVAREVFKLDCTIDEVKSKYKPFRYRAKKVSFGIVYGMTEHGLSADPAMGMTKEQAKVFIAQYMATYPGIAQYVHDMIEFARYHGYVETMFGHRRPVPDINHPKEFVRKPAENVAINTPIQGTGADIIRIAMLNLQKAVRDKSSEVYYMKPVMQIHDELQTEVPIEYASHGAWHLKRIMELPIPGFSEIMPIVAEPAVGKVWGHALDIQWQDNDINQPYVVAKKVKLEATDVTMDMIDYMIPLYERAGIEVRVKDNTPKAKH